VPRQSILRLIKRWRRYEERGNWKRVPRRTRGLYVLYRTGPSNQHEVIYIGVAGLGPGGTGSIRSRLAHHHRSKRKEKKQKKDRWTHYSMFEVHDNITREEIRELEALFLAIFRDDGRIGLTNKQTGSKLFSTLRRELLWKES
jgi:hypothetical protein